MNANFVEIFTHMRDTAKVKREGDRRRAGTPGAPAQPDYALVECRKFDAPSKAHVKRIARNGNGSVPAPRPIPAMKHDTAVLRAQLDFANMLDARAGGTRTIGSKVLAVKPGFREILPSRMCEALPCNPLPEAPSK